MATRRSSKGHPESPIRILCFGDSLTAGYPIEHPYAGRLSEKLEAAFPGRKVECDAWGLAGGLVIGNYASRLERIWNSAKYHYDWTIVLGGTNDLAWDKPTDQVLEALKHVWDISLSKGSKVLALTIPEAETGALKSHSIVNDGIKNYEKENYYHFDLCKALPYFNMPPEDRAKYWDPDGVHLLAAGYDLMGEKIGDGLVRILRLAEAYGTELSSIVSDKRQRKAIEDLIFEEEIGDPRLLSQGYIVVRKRDLD